MENFKIVYSQEFERMLSRLAKKDHRTLIEVEYHIEKILSEPQIGKPLRYSMKNRRRLHVGSFVLIYEIHNNELRFIDYDHHDKIYKKYR